MKDDERYLIIVNLSGDTSQARVRTSWRDLGGEAWRLSDAFSGATYDRDGNEMLESGLYVELGPWQFNLFQCGVLQSRGNKHIGKQRLSLVQAH